MEIRNRAWSTLFVLALHTCANSGAIGQFVASGELEIHYINFGQGGATLIVGPEARGYCMTLAMKAVGMRL